MKWRIDTTVPKEGDVRQVRRFAWLPVVAKYGADHYNVWLESYIQVQRYTKLVAIDDEGVEDTMMYWVREVNMPLFHEYEGI
jgi:hypothetical protein